MRKSFSILLLLLALVSFHSSSAATSETEPATETVTHSPAAPRPGQPVTVTARLPDLQSATLQIQRVAPGAYIRRTDPAFETNWRDFPMERHGPNHIALVPAEFQKHRHLVRYRIKGIPEPSAKSSGKTPIFYPFRTNAVPNFSWFTYGQLPEWKGASRAGRTPELTFSPEFLATLPAYHLIANATDVKNSQWNQDSYRQPFHGTLVYDGRVYDHIVFHNRGQASTYLAGKNKWGIKFNSADPFAARNQLGQLYTHPWNGMNLNPCASAWVQVNRGMAGMDEALSYRAYQLAGVPSPDTFWIHFRVIDSAAESSDKQYNSDLWGLYLVVQEKSGAWLREKKLADGNIYSIDSGIKHLAPGSPATQNDLRAFTRASSRPQSEDWWRENFDLPAYYSFHAVNRFVANIDLRPQGNHYLYHPPDNRWVILPHDLDMMLIPKHHQPGFVRQSRCLELPGLKLEYQARAREILDLFASDSSPTGGQIGQLIAELSSRVAPPGQPRNWAELDESMWNWHPRSQFQGEFYVTPYDDHRMGGHWTRTLATPDFAGFCKYILEFCTDSRPKKNFRPNDGNQRGYGYGYLALEGRDNDIPDRPTILSSGTKEISTEDLSFSISPFSSPTNADRDAAQWRVAQINAPGLAGYAPGQPYRYEIETGWTSGELTDGDLNITIAPEACAVNRTYRVRARYKDNTGRWSHWSAPIQFVAKK